MARTKKTTKTTKKGASKGGRKPKTEKTEKAEKAPKVHANRKLIDAAPEVPALEGEKSGAYIKRLLQEETFTTDEIVGAVKDYFPDSKVSASDVAFHRAKLKADGKEVKLVRQDKEGQRYTLIAA